MKKGIAGFLCLLMIFASSCAGAESAQWLSPWLGSAESIRTGEGAARAEIRLSVNADEMENLLKKKQEAASGGETLMLATAAEYLRAIAALLNETTLELAVKKDQLLLRAAVGGFPLFDLTGWAEQTAEGEKRCWMTNLLPSYLLTTTQEIMQGSDESARQLGELADALMACSKEEGGLNLLRDKIESERRLAAYFLGDAEQAAFTSEQYAALLPGAPRAPENSAYGLVSGFAAAHEDGADGTASLYKAQDGATYSFEKTADGYIARVTSAETISAYQEKTGGQGYQKVEQTYDVIYTVTLRENAAVYDVTGRANTEENSRVTIDCTDPDLTRMTYASETSDGWINLSRDGAGQRVSCKVSQGDVTVKGDVRADNDAALTELRFAVNDVYTVFVRCAFDKDGTLQMPETEGKKEIAFQSADGQNFTASDADMRLIMNELYTVTRPKLIDFVLTKLPKGAAGLTSMLMALVMQIGR